MDPGLLSTDPGLLSTDPGLFLADPGVEHVAGVGIAPEQDGRDESWTKINKLYINPKFPNLRIRFLPSHTYGLQSTS